MRTHTTQDQGRAVKARDVSSALPTQGLRCQRATCAVDPAGRGHRLTSLRGWRVSSSASSTQNGSRLSLSTLRSSAACRIQPPGTTSAPGDSGMPAGSRTLAGLHCSYQCPRVPSPGAPSAEERGPLAETRGSRISACQVEGSLTPVGSASITPWEPGDEEPPQARDRHASASTRS